MKSNVGFRLTSKFGIWAGIAVIVSFGLTSCISKPKDAQIEGPDSQRELMFDKQVVNAIGLDEWERYQSFVESDSDVVVVCDADRQSQSIPRLWSDGASPRPKILVIGLNHQLLNDLFQENIHGLITLLPFEIGYCSVEMLYKEQQYPMPATGFNRISIPPHCLRKSDVRELRYQLTEIDAGEGPPLSLDWNQASELEAIELIIPNESFSWNLVQAGAKCAAGQANVKLTVTVANKTTSQEDFMLASFNDSIVRLLRGSKQATVLSSLLNSSSIEISEHIPTDTGIELVIDINRVAEQLVELMTDSRVKPRKIWVLHHPQNPRIADELVPAIEGQLQRTVFTKETKN